MEPGFRLPSGPRADSYWSDVITHRQKSCLTPTSPSKSVLPMMSQKWMIGPVRMQFICDVLEKGILTKSNAAKSR
ncbi:hypothetical protein ACVWZR_006898 [Bradyrhizobium sp. i1.3.1]